MRSHAYNRLAEGTSLGHYEDGRGPLMPVVWTASAAKGEILLEDSVRRPRPSDLFLNQTPAVNRSRHLTYGIVSSHYVRDDGAVMRESGPVSHWAEVVLPSDPLLVRSDFDQIDQKVRLKIKDQKVDLLSACAELRQTTSLFTDLAQDVVQTFRTLRRGQPVAAVRRLLSDPRTRADRALANRWLSYSFGVKPLMQDIYGLAEASVAKFTEGMDLYTRSGTTETREERVDLGLVTGSIRVTVRKRVVARYRVQKSENRSLAQLGVLNPAAFLWQIAPWSFAIDWIYGVGNFLEGFDALLGISNLYVYRSGGKDYLYRQGVPILIGGTDSINGFEKIRQRFGVSDELSLGSPKIKSISDTGDLGGRLANVSSLIRQIVR